MRAISCKRRVDDGDVRGQERLMMAMSVEETYYVIINR